MQAQRQEDLRYPKTTLLKSSPLAACSQQSRRGGMSDAPCAGSETTGTSLNGKESPMSTHRHEASALKASWAWAPATPIVYEQNGKQYLVIMAGGHHFMMTPLGDSLIAYALPDKM
jgi:hypothetical protein